MPKQPKSIATPLAPPAPVIPPPTAAPVVPPVETPETPAVDPFMAGLLKSIDKVVTPDGDFKMAEPEAKPVDETAKKPSGMTLGEELAWNEKKRKDAEALAAKPVEELEPEPAPLVPPAPAEPPAPVAKLKKKDPAPPAPLAPLPAPVVPPTPAEPPVPAPVADPDAAFIVTLDDDQKDELQMAEFAEKKFPELAGMRAKTLNYFKKVEEFGTKNPDATPDDAQQFINSVKPDWKPGQKKKVERTFVTEMATAAATEAAEKKFQPEIDAAKNRIKLQELQPLITKAVGEFESLMTSSEAVGNSELTVMPAEVGQKIAEVGYEKALEDFAIEAPIYQSHKNAASEWMKLTNGLTKYNPANPAHNWLYNFVDNQGRIYATNPKSVAEDGRRFMPLAQHLELSRINPDEARKYYTFNDQNVLDMLALNANTALNDQLKKLEKAGFKREKKNNLPVPANTPAPVVATPAPAPVAAAPSPKGRSAMLPGAATPTKVASGNADFLEKIAPGSTARLGIE